MAGPVIQVVDGEGEFTDVADWFAEDAEMGAEVLSIIAVLGPQASGKSTLCNSAFGTGFEVASRKAVGTATTKGIAAAKASSSQTTLVLDIEGSDSRARGRSGKQFQARCASLATSLADAIVLNFWYHDIGRVEATGYNLLEVVFREALKSIEDGGFKSSLIFAIRDVDDDVTEQELHELMRSEATEMWKSMSSSAELDQFFSLTTIALPHMRHRPDEFNNACSSFGRRITDTTAGDYLLETSFSKGVPADSCVVFARGVWDSFSATSYRASTSGVDAGARGTEEATGEDSLMAAYRCNEAFSEALQTSTPKLTELGQSLDDGEKVEGLGQKMGEIMTSCMQTYDDAAMDHVDEPIHARKRRELEKIVDTSLHALYLKQIQLVRESALAHFKSSISSEDMPSDFAFFTADSLFAREAEESKRPGSSWSYNTERTDLQNMMQEISTQRKRLLTSQVAAAQQNANAMQYLQVQHAHMQAMQQQSYGGSAGQWNVGAAYRPPDTNINASLSYQQGRTNIQISMVPDESASLLGPNGFTAGVGPGNLGLSFNINV